MTIKSSDLANAVREVIATEHQPNTVLQQLSTKDADAVARLMVRTLRMIEIPVEDDLPDDSSSQDILFPKSVTLKQQQELIAQMNAAGGPRVWAEKLIGVMSNRNRDPKR